jgi:hypothetical protein
VIGELVYLAAPYSHPDPDIREARFQAVNRHAAAMMAAGVFVFSPISHTHPIAEAGALPLGWDFWEAYDRAMISRCSRVAVLTLDGWRESVGVTAEIRIAGELGLDVEFHAPSVIDSTEPAQRVNAGPALTVEHGGARGSVNPT